MQREIVKLSVDATQVVRLDFSDGKEVTSAKTGKTQWQYTLDHDSRIMWLPLAGKQAIERSGAQAGDQVRLLKTFMGQKTVFTAQVIDQHASAPPVPPAPPQRPIRTNGSGKAKGKVNGFPLQAYYQPESNPAKQPYYATEQPAPAPQAAEVVPTQAAAASHISACLRQAIDAIADAQEYGLNQGIGVTFLGSDVRAIALSIYIGDQQRGNR